MEQLTEEKIQQIEENRLKAIQKLMAKKAAKEEEAEREKSNIPSVTHSETIRPLSQSKAELTQERIQELEERRLDEIRALHGKKFQPSEEKVTSVATDGSEIAENNEIFQRIKLAYKTQQDELKKQREELQKNSITCEAIVEDDKVCGSAKVDMQLYEHFHEQICFNCKTKDPHLYKLMSKQEAMKQFMVPDDSFQLFSFMPKPNPHNNHWQPMKLYLAKQILQFSIMRYGNVEGIEKEREKREQKKFQKKFDKVESELEQKAKEFQRLFDSHQKYLVEDDHDSERNPSLLEKRKSVEGEDVPLKKSQSNSAKRKKFLNHLLPCFNQPDNK